VGELVVEDVLFVDQNVVFLPEVSQLLFGISGEFYVVLAVEL
jgi:hypothetical protein